MCILTFVEIHVISYFLVVSTLPLTTQLTVNDKLGCILISFPG